MLRWLACPCEPASLPRHLTLSGSCPIERIRSHWTDFAASAPRRPPPPLSRGSSRSRTASPNMFRQYTTIVRHSPGHSASRGATSMNSRPSRLSIPPQLGTEIGRPNPRKLSAASLMITPPTLMVKMMITGAAILGRTWWMRVPHRAPPIDRRPRRTGPGRAGRPAAGAPASMALHRMASTMELLRQHSTGEVIVVVVRSDARGAEARCPGGPQR